MKFITNILSELQAAIAVVAARERRLTAMLVAVWGRIGRMRVRLERLIALWRAGKLPQARKSRAGRVPTGDRTASVVATVPAWVLARVGHVGTFRGQLEHLLSQAECVEFLAAVPQAGRIFRPLLRMVGIEVAARQVRTPPAVWGVPEDAPKVASGGLVVRPGGRLMWV